MADESRRRTRLSTSRLGRLFDLGTLGLKAAPLAARGVGDDPESRARALAAASELGDAMLKTLGEMKGLPLKLGQMLSYIDGLAPPGQEARLQAALERLQQRAPPLDPAAAVAVVEQDLGEHPERVFARWEREPFAAASIGQVHRAVTRGGDAVAVKVQYPGIDKAIEADLKSLSALEAIASPFGRRYHSKDYLDEVSEVFRAELDYGREAEMTELFRAATADLPGVVVPRVHHALSSRRVLVTDFVDGLSYAELARAAPPEARNCAAATIWSFVTRSMLRYGLLYADPHPGNYRFLEDGRVAFLDFGCVKLLPHPLVAGIKRYIRAGIDEDWEEFDRALVEVLGYDRSDEAGWALYRAYSVHLLAPFASRTPFRVTKEVAREAVQFLARGQRELVLGEVGALRLPKPIHMPRDFTFVNRLQWGLLSVLAGLDATVHFRALGDPWLREPERAVKGLV